jgi:type IV secretory pathway TraG/TraD family ATPase VirD4
LIYLYKNGKTRNSDIWEHFAMPVQDLAKLYKAKGTGLIARDRGALKHIHNPESTTASSIVSIVQERLQFFRYLNEEPGEAPGTFSFRDFISNVEKPTGTLFLMNIQQYESIFRPLMTFVVDIMSREVLSLTDSRDRRITFVIDEFGSLAKMSSIFGFLTMGRSKGGFLVLANQDLGSVSNVYGQDQKETFFNNFNIHLTFRLNDPTTSEFLARGFGKREVIKKYKSSSFSPSDLGDRFTLGEQEKVEEIVLSTEFQTLPNFHSYLKIANYGVTKMETKKEFLETPQPEFIQRDFNLERHEPEKPADTKGKK